MTEDRYNAACMDLTELAKKHLEEGTAPEELIMALESLKFTLLMQRWNTAQAYSTLFPSGVQDPDNPNNPFRR